MTKESTLRPGKRWSEVQEWMAPVRYIQLGDVRVGVSDSPIRDGIAAFDYPELSFGNEGVLSMDPGMDATDFDDIVVQQLERFGPRSSPLDEQWIAVFHSESNRELALEAFDEIRALVERYTGLPLRKNPGGVRYDDRAEFDEWLNRYADRITGAFALLDDDSDRPYYQVIDAIGGKPVQHMRQKNFLESRNYEFSFSLFHTAMDLASKLGVRPFLLRKGLTSDAVIGLSVTGGQHTTACSVTVSGDSGDVIHWTDRPHGRGQSTVTNKDLATQLVGDAIVAASDNIGELESLVVHRNGDFGNEEIAGIEAAINEARGDGTVSDNLSWSAVELRNNTSYRIYVSEGNQECDPGSFAHINENTLLLAPTGRGFIHQGTPTTFKCKVAAGTGDLDIRDIGKDVFDLSFLAWWSPGSKLSEPISTRYPSRMHDLFEHCDRLRYLPS